ncbi:hypothetical protein [Ferrigenium sp. UT5]|uniref:hypothetical protein n=1 Tax=Ferrigenium sp. UT5 TaxID=3242105 RepID=UPI00354B1DBD
MKATSIILTLLIAMLIGCTTLSGTGNAPLSATQSRLAALAKVKNDVSLIMEVPSANNAISNQIMVTSIKAGADATAVVNLVAILKGPNTKPIAVIGDNDAVTAATIEAALKRLQGFKPSAKLYFVGETSYVHALKVQADAEG